VRTAPKTPIVLALLIATVLATAIAMIGGSASGGDERGGRLLVRGGATTIVQRGTGSPDFVPVITKLAFHWDGTDGWLECLALAPSEPAGEPGSGDFDTNAMYVTGPITAGRVGADGAVLRGTATVTGLGAGKNEPFRLVARRGGPGTTVVLHVSGLVFREIVLDGEIGF
jgi:hypothetical protein